jgi:hypothetical protein
MVCACENIDIGFDAPHINLQEFRNIVNSVQETYVVTANLEQPDLQTLDTIAFEAGVNECAKVLVVYNNDSVYIKTNNQWCILCGSDGYYGIKCVGIVPRGTPENQFINEGFTNVAGCESILVLDNENYEAWIKPSTSGNFKEIVRRGIDCIDIYETTRPLSSSASSSDDDLVFDTNLFTEDCEDTFDSTIMSFKKDGLLKISFKWAGTYSGSGAYIPRVRFILNGIVECESASFLTSAITNETHNCEFAFNVLENDILTVEYLHMGSGTYPVTRVVSYSTVSMLFWEY